MCLICEQRRAWEMGIYSSFLQISMEKARRDVKSRSSSTWTRCKLYGSMWLLFRILHTLFREIPISFAIPRVLLLRRLSTRPSIDSSLVGIRVVLLRSRVTFWKAPLSHNCWCRRENIVWAGVRLSTYLSSSHVWSLRPRMPEACLLTLSSFSLPSYNLCVCCPVCQKHICFSEFVESAILQPLGLRGNESSSLSDSFLS